MATGSGSGSTATGSGAGAGATGFVRPKSRAQKPRLGASTAAAGSMTGSSASANGSGWRSGSTASGSSSASATGSCTSGSGSGSAAGSGVSTVSTTRVPHPEGSSRTVPLARSASHSTRDSGSTWVILISPNSPRWRAERAEVGQLCPQLGR